MLKHKIYSEMPTPAQWNLYKFHKSNEKFTLQLMSINVQQKHEQTHAVSRKLQLKTESHV